MQSKNVCPSVREGDTIENEWSRVSYDLWCREQACDFVKVPGVKIVDTYAVVRSVITNDLTPAEREAVVLRWYRRMSVSQIAVRTGTSTSNVYNTLSRATDKLRNVLKHLIPFEDYRIETDN